MGLGKGLIVAGVALVVVGAAVMLASKLGLRLFQLPGDIVWRSKNGVIYIPVVTSVLLSVIFSMLLFVLRR